MGDQEGEISFRYYVVANFDFVPLADNYPFDMQHIYISFIISDQSKYGIIQPIPNILLDREFNVDGWKLTGTTSGISMKVLISKQPFPLEKNLESDGHSIEKIRLQ